MRKSTSAIYLIAFILLATLLLAMLPSSCGGGAGGVREGIDDTLNAPLPSPPPSNGALQNSIKQLNERLVKLEASVKESQDSVKEGALKADAAAGNLQLALPA